MLSSAPKMLLIRVFGSQVIFLILGESYGEIYPGSSVLAYLHTIFESKVCDSGRNFHCTVKKLFCEECRWREAIRRTFENLKLQHC